MTETTLKIQLSELTVVRICCRKRDCAGVIEVPVSGLVNLERNTTMCPMCKGKMISSANVTSEPFQELGKVLDRLTLMQGQFSLEFPIRLDAPPADTT